MECRVFLWFTFIFTFWNECDLPQSIDKIFYFCGKEIGLYWKMSWSKRQWWVLYFRSDILKILLIEMFPPPEMWITTLLPSQLVKSKLLGSFYFQLHPQKIQPDRNAAFFHLQQEVNNIRASVCWTIISIWW